jgi:geranylgeranyl diphosphate synthase type I
MCPASDPAAVRGRGGARKSGPRAFVGLLDEIRHDVDALLTRVFDQKLAHGEKIDPALAAMIGAVRDLTLRGGKRLRPALLFAGYRGIDPRAPRAVAIRAGAAFELLQTYLLVHDDWMDQDDVRRGGPAVHVALARHLGSRRAGDAAAVLAGDYAAALALEMLALTGAPAERIALSLTLFAQVQQDVTSGQQIDLVARPRDIERMYDLKSGSYTVRGPVLIGAVLAGATTEALIALAHFAQPLGVAFQMRDDLLGTFGDPGKTGKPAGSDVRSGKRTALFAEALARATPADRRTLRSTVGRVGATDRAVRAVVDIFERSGARAAVEQRTRELAREARAALARAALSAPGSVWLDDAIDALTIRRH